MAAVVLIPQDLTSLSSGMSVVRAMSLIEGVTARTAIFAPYILDPTFAYEAAAKDLLIVACLRRYQADGGTVTRETVGPFSVTVDRSAMIGLYTASEMDEWAQIKRLIGGGSSAPLPQGDFPAALPWPDPVCR